MGGIGTLVGPIVGAGFFQLARELLSRLFGDQFPYLIPLGMVFIAMIIFLPQGMLGLCAAVAERASSGSAVYSKNAASAAASFLSAAKSSAKRS